MVKRRSRGNFGVNTPVAPAARSGTLLVLIEYLNIK